MLPELAEETLGLPYIRIRCEPAPVYIPPQFDVEGSPEVNNKGHPNPRSGPSGKDASNVRSSSSFSTPPTGSAESQGSSFFLNGPVIRPKEDEFRIAVLTMHLNIPSPEFYTVFVAISDLFARAKAHERAHKDWEHYSFDDAPVPFSPLVFLWDEWGPQSTRIMKGSSSASWMCYAYMHRFVYHNHTEIHDEWDTPNAASLIHILDFNPNNLHPNSPPYRRGPKEESDPPTESIIIDQPTATPANRFAAEKFVTALPFRRTTTSLPFNESLSPMIDAERILLIEVCIGTVVLRSSH
jgi:hypothetical protein